MAIGAFLLAPSTKKGKVSFKINPKTLFYLASIYHIAILLPMLSAHRGDGTVYSH